MCESEFPSACAEFATRGTRRSNAAAMSSATSGSYPSFIITPAVVCGTYRWHKPPLHPVARTAASISSVTSCISVRRNVRTCSLRIAVPPLRRGYVSIVSSTFSSCAPAFGCCPCFEASVNTSEPAPCHDCPRATPPFYSGALYHRVKSGPFIRVPCTPPDRNSRVARRARNVTMAVRREPAARSPSGKA